MCKQLTVEIEFNFHRSKNVVTTQVYAERQNMCPVSTSQKEFRVTLTLKHYPTLKLHNTAWQEIVTTLAAQNKVLRRRFSCSTRKNAPRKSKSVCVRQASEQPERKSTDCVKCYKEKKKWRWNPQVRNTAYKLKSRTVRLCRVRKLGLVKTVSFHKLSHNVVTSTDCLTNKFTKESVSETDCKKNRKFWPRVVQPQWIVPQ